jgi:hypothetical protein
MPIVSFDAMRQAFFRDAGANYGGASPAMFRRDAGTGSLY